MEKLFKLIREENVVLFVGAGFSMYTGLPSGNKLKEELINSVPDLREDLNYNDSLSKVADDIINLQNGSRNDINNLLKKLFNKTNFDNLETHQKLASIPHINSIITTNYDKTLEIAYSDNHHLIYKDNDLAYIEKSKTNIYKIHGTIDSLDSIILSKKDYNDLYKNNFSNSLIWSQIKSLLTTKTVVYIGYGHEDDNIDVITDFIHDSLGSNFKEAYLISPNLKKTKLAELNRKKIKYIDSTGEEFINSLLENINENILDDHKNKIVSDETFTKFLHQANIKPTIKKEEDSNTIVNLESKDGNNLVSNFSLSLNKESDKNKEFLDFVNGDKIGTLEITKEDIIHFSSSISGITYIKPDNIEHIYLKSTPSYTGKIDLSFDNGFNFDNIDLNIYRTNSKINFELSFFNKSIISVSINFKDINSEKRDIKVKVNFNFSENYTSVKEEYLFYKMCNFIVNYQPFKVIENNEVKYYSQNYINLNFDNEFTKQIQFTYESFKLLHKIEKKFNCRFKEVIDLNTSLNVKAIKILKGYGNYIIQDYPVITITKPQEVHELDNIIKDTSFKIKANEKDEEIVELHGLRFLMDIDTIEFKDIDTSELFSKQIVKIKNKSKAKYTYKNIRLE
ncbi:Uncharacterised protein [Algoriella xinjiangensis]|uniref:SIR2 family protein n=1 Tax=Algoriella xinjiangensis TaxID=684065 RepID=UPI000F63E0CE|nr:SIR2 family protein [Algoriella xinjiangensis]VDH16996.1 Uncharacterised protein [Algoriella xinjiangensis]